MASDTNNPTTQLQNSYFFYGTHPLKVPNHLVHANSANSLATVDNDHLPHHHHHNLSLNLNHRHEFTLNNDSLMTKSLNNLVTSRNDDDENSEVRAKKKKKINMSIN